ncbi:MAG TPA: glutamine--fructose-6-phosphate transaminase (isomerizing) [Methylophaga aminisulfidivorans]|uniref:glutamine--fructose-6-phosphate transaminase (isomerizing) n=1 Tax=Methylophaga TaxID=40222 RepID=UPI0017558801|nr:MULTISPECIES: glutamine--fructose-6-phosphate transaminase (isomerizing) [Methylophaga]WVI86100.1 glutamine--fructose-6-phosphate transaminase (isomerizing) [Methylophaga thalassica]HIC47120.1 glutamine--fructose-6-phosphate transaminase (isomerizing) [Methylophaga sp.]HIM40898.1 glutamine--fructose-6-phosphate transaminase (isomerizing) [Methylophaga aminisulfidivorans]
MCGIVGGIAERNVNPILMEGLRRLEYRGYDSSGMALLDDTNELHRVRSLGKIQQLQDKVDHLNEPFTGRIGIAHTRWATHGIPSENNAHPHICNNQVAVVHNGIIENYQSLKQKQLTQGYRFTSETDTEVVAHEIHAELQQDNDLLQAVLRSLKVFDGAYALGVMDKSHPDMLVAARKGSPLVIGIGIGEHFIASDVSALLPVTQNFIFLEDGDVAKLTRDKVEIYSAETGELVERPIKQSSLNITSVELGEHRHYMHKEIFEQPQAVIDTLEGRITQDQVLVSSFGPKAEQIFKTVERIHIIACGTSYHAGMVTKYWMEDIIRLPCQVEVASEFRYRNPVILDNTLFVMISQSGETADTLAALHQINHHRKVHQLNGITTLSICNVAESSLTRDADMTYLTHAGPEIGVASTKSFTTQLVVLALLLTSIGKVQKRLNKERESMIAGGLQKLPNLIRMALEHEDEIREISQLFADKQHALFLGRGTMFPIALEGALKLKEISYIHAEAYPAGELKHGPLALIDETMPVIAIAPLDDLLEKLKSNLQEVKARGGQMIVFEDERSDISSETSFKVVKATTNVGRITAPITYNILLQLLCYHVALIKGTDVDQPRNLAKSVTVE